MVIVGAQASSIVSADACETEPVIASVENANLSPQSPRLVLEQSLQQQNLEDAVLEQIPTQLEMFKQLREMQSRLKATEDALVDYKRELEKKSGSKREAEGPSGPYEKYKSDQRKTKAGASGRYCWRCHSKHAGECTSATVRCKRCGENGHAVRDCINEVKCFNCKESGHMSTTCPKEKVELKRGNKKMKIRMS